MKTGLLTLLGLLSTTAMASPKPIDLLCRSYDYYELAGNRKVVEIAVTREAGGTYDVKLSHIFETLSNGQYTESSRTVRMDLTGLTCTQADPTVDPNVISCSNPGVQSYFGLSRIDETVVMSPFSSKPGNVIKTHRYESTIFGNGAEQDGFKDGLSFDPRDCALK